MGTASDSTILTMTTDGDSARHNWRQHELRPGDRPQDLFSKVLHQARTMMKRMARSIGLGSLETRALTKIVWTGSALPDGNRVASCFDKDSEGEDR